MIRINLLPVELRRGNRLPAKVLAVAFGAALAVSASVGWFGLVYFGDLSAAEQALEEADGKLVEKERRVAYHTQLEANRKDYGERVKTIQAIGKSRRLWSKFLDDLIDVVNNNGDTERHVAWFDSITVKSDPKKGTSVTMPGSVQDADKSRIANLHEDLDAAPFAKDMVKSEPTWKVEVDKVRMPPVSLNFPLVLTFPPPVLEAAPGKGGAKAAPKTPPAAAPNK